MERVKTQIELLSQKITGGASPGELLQAVEILRSELLHLASSETNGVMQSVAIIPNVIPAQRVSAEESKAPAPAPEERTVEVLQIDEAEVEAELNELRRQADEKNQMSLHNKPSILFERTEEIPTLIQRQPATAAAPEKKEVPQTISLDNASLNDSLRQEKTELADSLRDAPVKDLKKAIGVNDRFVFLSELFRGDETMYERSIKTINGFSIFPEAEYWIRRELKLKLGWDDKNETVRQFDQLVRRRFL